MSKKTRTAGFYKNRTVGIFKNNKGLTLVELIIALAISVIVVAAAGFILLTQSGVIRFNRSVSTEQQRLNTAFNAVKYSLRMAGFDYGNSSIKQGSVPPVQIIVNATYPNPYEVLYNPYEVLVSYSKVSSANPVPPPNIVISQVLFYWGNNITNGYNFNAPFNTPGNLYECQVAPPVVIPPTVPTPTCIPNTTITLGDYINNFSVTPQGYNSFNNPLLSYYITSTSPAGQIEVHYSGTNVPSEPPYLNLSITGESNVALSDSPAYSVNVPYNSNTGGAGAKGNAGQIVGNNVLKTLNSSVFLRNVYYGS